jgi:hypothetical protein
MNGRSGVIMVTVGAFVVLFIAMVLGWLEWWLAPFVVIAGFVIMMALVPRQRQPEIRGENKYHLHP